MQSSSYGSLPSIRAKAATLVLVCLIPSLIGFATLVYDTFQRERTNLLSDATRRSATLTKAVELQLDMAETAARALATSPSLASGDLAAFHSQARAILRPQLAAVGFILSDTEGKVLLNTRMPYTANSAALPASTNPAQVRAAAASGDVLTSGVRRASPADPWFASIEVPVYIDGDVRYVLSALVAPERIADAFGELQLPPDWRAAIIDNNYKLVGRTLDQQRLLGQPANAGVVAALKRADSGIAEVVTRDKLDVLVAFTRSPLRGWATSVSVPRNAAYTVVGASMSSILLSVGGLMTVGFLTAWFMGGLLGRSVRALRGPAVALGRGEPVIIPPMDIREAAEVGAALEQVAEELNRHRSGLEERVRERTVELENAYALLENVYATAPAGLALLDADLRMVMVNDYLAAINQKPISEHIGKTLPELLGPVGVEYEKAYRQVRDTGEPLLSIESAGEVPYDPGVVHHWLVSYHPVFNHDRKLVGVSGLVLDVSEHRRLTDKLRDVSEQFHILYEMSGDAHMLVRPGIGFIEGNRAAATIFGCTSVEQFLTLTPVTASPEFQPDGRRSDEKAAQVMRYALERGSYQFEWLHKRLDGSLFHADVLLTRLDASGKEGVLQATVRDISERIAAEMRLQSLNEQLVQALERAKTASRTKSEFLANMSHEIRTPMNAIMGLARLLEESPLARRERGYVAKIKMSTRSLLGILNDVLDFSKIEAGQLMLEYTAFRIDQVLDSIAVLMAPSAAAKGIELVFAVRPEVPMQVVGDPMRLEQVLLNLVSNAIKFTETGEVVLTIGLAGHSGDSVTLAFSVRDTGIGIAAEHHATMFDAFSQADSSTSRKFGGTGLGLTICRRLVGLMGGAIAVDSAPGRGSDFRFDSTFGIAAQGGTAQLPDLPKLPGLASGQRPLRALVVDDNAAAREAVAAQCAAFGWQVDRAADGPQALELLRATRAPGTPGYDFMFVDAMMPGLDGVSVLTYARADSGIAMPLSALMAAEVTRERIEALAFDLKLDAMLVKPVTREALVAAIVEMHTGRPLLPDAASMPLAGQLDGIYVLLVEDNQINQEVANYLLLHAGAAVDIAANGQIAVDMLAAAPTRYDAVLMDIQMPVMNGYEATEAIRALGLADLPIIAMTANVMEDDRARAINAGMNGHIAKPIDVDSMVAQLLRATQGGQEGHEGEVRGAAHGVVPPGASSPAPAAIPGIDLHSTLPRFGGSFGNFVTLFKRFESSQGGTLAEVRQLLRGGERDAAAQLVHRLRGVAANLGATDFAALALDFEHALRSGIMSDLISRLDTLEVELAKLMVAARNLQPPTPVPAPTRSVDARLVSARLADLLTLLQNNNLKAIADFEALHQDLADVAEPDEVARLADAIATLAFPNAAQQVSELLKRKVAQ